MLFYSTYNDLLSPPALFWPLTNSMSPSTVNNYKSTSFPRHCLLDSFMNKRSCAQDV